MMDDRFVRFDRTPMHDNVDQWSTENILELVVRLALVAVFVWAVVVLVNQIVKYLNSHASTDDLSPLDIAKQRLAKGEITKAEFEGLKKELK